MLHVTALPLQDGPAARAGVIAGDQLISIDGAKPGAGRTAGWLLYACMPFGYIQIY